VLPAILGALYDRGIRSILVEGGGTVYTSFLQAGLFDQLTLFVAPLLLGRGVELVGDLTTRRVADAVRLQGVTTRIINDQVMISGYRDLDRMRRLVVPAAEREEAAPARAG
jgi:riboflavin biosynthesis pyrimidine reductase